jgi:exodeoxyribonuclease V alpha subunit
MSRQRFVPFGTVSSRPEFAVHMPITCAVPAPIAALWEAAGAGLLDVDEELFWMAYELISLESGLDEAAQHAAFTLLLAVLLHTRQGSTCLPLGAPLEAVVLALLPADAGAVVAHIRALIDTDRLPALLGGPGDYRPLILDGGALYPQRLWHYEARLAEALAERLSTQRASVDTTHVGRALAEVLGSARGAAGQSMALTDEQQYAVLTAIHAPLTLITGGPGTGKTSVIVSLLRLLVRLGVAPERIALAAPTGKAANRMVESIMAQLSALPSRIEAEDALAAELPRAQTLHRLLGWSQTTGQFHHHAHHRLPAQVVIVDEASMIDLFLMDRLIRAVDPEAHLVLLGDADQLPSVEAGAVLRELLPAVAHTAHPWRLLVRPPIPPTVAHEPLSPYVARLTRSHRMREDDPAGRQILSLANAIRSGEVRSSQVAGEADSPAPLLRRVSQLAALEWLGVELYEVEIKEAESILARERLRGFIDAWFARFNTPPQGFQGLGTLRLDAKDGGEISQVSAVRAIWEQVARARVLCMTKVFASGTRAINELFLERVRAALGARPGDVFMPGVPVMMLRNDYERELFNGDHGIILPVRQHGRREQMAVFPCGAGFRALPLESLRAHLEPSFAMTVHKSQGSEFQHIALVLPAEGGGLLTRELLYTALTRASRSALIIGAERALIAGARAHMERHGQLLLRLGQHRDISP